MRYTKKDIEGMFSRLCRAAGRNQGWEKKGEWSLDYAACYGGYTIFEARGDSSIDHPFATLRRDTREMYLSMLMAAQALENFKHENN